MEKKNKNKKKIDEKSLHISQKKTYIINVMYKKQTKTWDQQGKMMKKFRVGYIHIQADSQ